MGNCVIYSPCARYSGSSVIPGAIIIGTSDYLEQNCYLKNFDRRSLGLEGEQQLKWGLGRGLTALRTRLTFKGH